jgi:AraC-like DNA-binding protein
VILSFGNEWVINGERRRSFLGGLHRSQVTTEHAGWSCGMHIGLVPWAAYALFGIPMHELAERTVAIEEVFPPDFVDRVQAAGSFGGRVALLDALFARRFAAAHRVSPEVIWAWERLRRTHGRTRIGTLADDLGWSRKRLVQRFREQIGLPPKATARLLRFERARALAGAIGWAELALACGYADQSHLVSEFRAFTGRTPETFLQDTARAGP